MAAWDRAKADFDLWYYHATTSDFCQEGDMRRPTKQMVRDTMIALDAAKPEWRQQIGGNAFALEIVKRYPELEKRRKV
jgi:hypothetical protein